MAKKSAKITLAQAFMDEIEKKRRRILIIGDAMIDVWITGDISLCQEGCNKITEHSCCTTPGGAANAKHSLSEWGVETSLIGQTEQNRPIKYRFLDLEGRVIFRYDDETMLKHKVGYHFARKEALRKIKSYDAVLLSDYDKGFLTPEFIQDVAGECELSEIPCVSDCKREPRIYEGTLLKANELWEMKHGGAHVVTRGPHSPIVIGKEIPVSSSDSIVCANHVGAGDCFGAHLALALGCGFRLEDATLIAHSASRIYVQHQYNKPPCPAEVISDLNRSTRS